LTAITRILNGERVQTQDLAIWSLVLGLAAASFATVFIRLAQQGGIPSQTIAFGRLGLAALLLTPFIMSNYRDELQQLRRYELALAATAGIFISLHFTLIATGLEYTSILVEQVIISTGPLWVGLLEMVFMKLRLSLTVWIGVIITIIGGGVIAFGNANGIGEGSDVMLGTGLIFIGAMLAAVYLIAGKKVRSRVSIWPYVWMVYSFGAMTSIVIMFISGTAVAGLPAEGYFWVVMLTLLPQLVGHSMFNYAVGYLPATMVSVSSQVLIVTAAFVAFLVFAEVPTIVDVIGSLIIGAGVLMAILGKKTHG